MNIGLDYDETYTRDPGAWDAMISLFRARGHCVYLVTWRYLDECGPVVRDLDGKVDGIFPTGRKGKEKYMYGQGIRIDVWIDDNPSAILRPMAGHFD